MSKVNFIDEFNVFMRYARSNQLTGRERLLWTALFAIANDRAIYNAQTKEYEWPGDFFPIPHNEMSLHSTLDKRGIESVRNSLKQRGLIDFRPGYKKRPAEYKINYLSIDIGYKNVPNDVPNDVPNSVPNNVPNGVPNDAPNSVPIYSNKYNLINPSCNPGETGYCGGSSEGPRPGESRSAVDWSRTAEHPDGRGEAAKREIEELTDNLFTLYGGRKAVMMDYIYAARWLPNLGYWEKNKLSFAFERAFRANKPGQWDYIDGCLTRMRMEELNPAEEQEGDNG